MDLQLERVRIRMYKRNWGLLPHAFYDFRDVILLYIFWSLLVTWLHLSVFSIWKSLQVLQKACMKIVARAIYTYRFFSFTYTLLLYWKKKVVLIAVFLSKLDHRPLFNDIYYETILVWGFVSVLLTNTTHSL